MSKPYNVLDIACFVVNKHNKLYPEKGITNLRLQKLLYFIQCYFYFEYNEPCFKEDMEAWDFGPVSREVYEEFSYNVSKNIENTYEYFIIDKETGLYKKIKFNEENISEKDKCLIEKVIEICSNKTNYMLVEISHSQSPWENNYEKNKKNKILNKDIKEFISNGKRK